VNRSVIFVVVALVAIWGIAALIVSWARSAAPTPVSVVELVESYPMADAVGADRDRHLRGVAVQLNRLNFEQRRELRNAPAFQNFTDSMNPEEMAVFLDLTLPEGFRQLMVALNAMTPERRKQIVERALADLEENGMRDAPRAEDDANARKIINEGLSSFYEDANVEVKLDFAPVIEQIQRSLQVGR